MIEIVRKNISVLTSDGFELGQTHKLYHRLDEAEPELKLFATYLMVVNFDIGDDFYVPTDYVDTAKWDGTAVYLTLSRNEVGQQSLTTLPQFIAAHRFREEKLPELDNSSKKQGKVLDDIAPS